MTITAFALDPQRSPYPSTPGSSSSAGPCRGSRGGSSIDAASSGSGSSAKNITCSPHHDNWKRPGTTASAVTDSAEGRTSDVEAAERRE